MSDHLLEARAAAIAEAEVPPGIADVVEVDTVHRILADDFEHGLDLELAVLRMGGTEPAFLHLAREALLPATDAILDAIRKTLEKASPELASDLLTTGMVMVGGGVMLRGLDKLAAEETGLPVEMAAEPITAVARGTGILLEDLDLYKDVLWDRELES